jgi:hypothetical protein
MTATLIIAALALLLAALLLRAVRGRTAMIRDLTDVEGRTRPVDLPAFRNLVDPAEEEYLRMRLSKEQFRLIHRQRLHAALDYIRRANNNAPILLRLGESARHDQNPELAGVARELVNSALRLRINALLATGILYARIAMPEAQISVAHVIDIYENVANGLVRLIRLQNPAYVSRIAAIF